MGVTAERLPRSRVSMEIEVEPERLEASMTRAVRKVGEQVKIPGFRPGKAPRNVIERVVGHPALLQEAIEDLLPDLYNEAIASESIEPIDQPEIELKSTEPLVVTATVPVRPTINLGDYEAIRVPRPEPTSPDDAIQEAIDDIRRRFATLEPVDRPVEWNDTVRCDVTVTVDGQKEPHVEEGAEFPVTEGGVVSLPGFLEHLIGLERGGPYEFEFDLPEDYASDELAGKTAHYSVQIDEVKQQILPDLDDDFVRSLDEEGIETVDQLRERVSENVKAQIEAEADATYRDEVIDLMLAMAELDYPEVLVEREIDQLVDQQSNHAAHTREDLDRWLEAIGRTEDEVRDALREQADLSVRRGLVLAEFADREEVAATDEEIDQEVSTLVEALSGDDSDLERRAQLRGIFDTPQQRSSIRSRILTERALERLVEIASQEDEAAESARPARRTSRRRRGARSGEGDDAADEATAELEDEQAADEADAGDDVTDDDAGGDA